MCEFFKEKISSFFKKNVLVDYRLVRTWINCTPLVAGGINYHQNTPKTFCFHHKQIWEIPTSVLQLFDLVLSTCTCVCVCVRNLIGLLCCVSVSTSSCLQPCPCLPLPASNCPEQCPTHTHTHSSQCSPPEAPQAWNNEDSREKTDDRCTELKMLF